MSRVVKRAEMVKIIAKETGITCRAADKAIGLLFSILRETVADQNAFLIPGVGTVKGYIRPEKMGRDPRNGKEILLKEKRMVKMTSCFKEKTPAS